MIFGPLESSINAATQVGLLIIGLVIGLHHSIEADHLAAVSTMVTTANNKSSKFRAPMLGIL
ncbi:hypothetical protein Ngar_c06060 [Candidatus Nitrososphaera gargensis Ga9.2]|uniref:Uncharacterized protein n=1 Tax=Nitrososphaera gargensis (strain Ga9.2) TaxID=1237085 RepID=K0IM45_NITGG|nr:hypothetical protein [Candidatus Nitrososphaera gargensis]AFU57549.1 hypothetical protein Ngar_c06060 [Candidatus Nitrososphaera gargensis Ga9.2]